MDGQGLGCDPNDSSNNGFWCQVSPEKCPIHSLTTYFYLCHSKHDFYSSFPYLSNCTSIFYWPIGWHQNRQGFLRFQKYMNIKRVFGKENPPGPPCELVLLILVKFEGKTGKGNCCKQGSTFPCKNKGINNQWRIFKQLQPWPFPSPGNVSRRGRYF